MSWQTSYDPGIPELSTTEYIGCMRLTQGTETSKYLLEKKEKSISSVAASERESAQNRRSFSSGVVGQRILNVVR